MMVNHYVLKLFSAQVNLLMCEDENCNLRITLSQFENNEKIIQFNKTYKHLSDP